MAFNKRTWKGRQGTGLNKFSINGATPVTVINQPDSVTEQGDALSAGNLNDLEDRIYTAFEDEATARDDADSNLKSAIQGNTARIENLEQEHGGYVPVQYRGDNAVPTGKAKYALVEKIVGKSRAWNQLVQNGNFDDSSNWADGGFYATSRSVADNIMTLYGASGNVDVAQGFGNKLVAGHKYLVSITPRRDVVGSVTVRFAGGGGNQNITFTGVPTSFIQCAEIVTADYNSETLLFFATGLTNTCQISKFFIRDLTLIFPEGVPSTVAECVQKCPDILKYDAYRTSIVDTTVEGVRSRGFNLLTDGNVELGTYDANGAEYPSSTGNWWRTADFVDVKPYMTYYAKIAKNYSTSNANIYAYFYDTDGNFISRAVNIGNSTFETPPNCYKVNLNYYFVTATLQTPTEMCLNISGSEDGTYKPYRDPVTLSLPSSVTLRSAGSVADTDELNVEVVVDGQKVNRRRQTTRVGSYTFTGTETWYPYEYFKQTEVMSQIKPSSSSSVVSDVLAPNLVACKPVDLYTGTVASGIAITDVGRVRIGLNDSLDGKAIYFELATESVTLLDPIENNTIQTEGGGTIETIQTQTPVIDNSLDVGYLAL